MRRLGAVGALLLLVGVSACAGWGPPTRVDRRDEITEPIERIRVDNASGDVTVREGEVTNTVVKQIIRYRAAEPDRAFEVDSGTLVLPGCGNRCSVDYEITAPRGTAVEGELSSGDVLVEGSAEVGVRVASGDVTLRLVGAETVSVEASSGDVSLDLDDVGSVTSVTKSGDTELTLGVVKHARVRCSSGHIRAVVPHGMYRVTGETASGDRDISGEAGASSSRSLELSTASGDVTVRTA